MKKVLKNYNFNLDIFYLSRLLIKNFYILKKLSYKIYAFVTFYTNCLKIIYNDLITEFYLVSCSNLLLPPLLYLIIVSFHCSTSHYINISYFWNRSFIRFLKPLLDCQLLKKDHLQINACLDSRVVEQKDT